MPLISVASLVGFGSVVAGLPAFETVSDWVMSMEGGPLISLAVSVNLLAALTGSASGGMAIALDALGETYMQLAAEHGIDPGLMHRVAVMAAGTLDAREENGRVVPTETPEACARRELAEETGYEAGALAKVAEWYAMPGGNDLRVHLFVATDLRRGQQRLDEGELIDEVRPFAPDELIAMVARGDIRDAKTLVSILHVLGRRREGVRIPS